MILDENNHNQLNFKKEIGVEYIEECRQEERLIRIIFRGAIGTWIFRAVDEATAKIWCQTITVCIHQPAIQRVVMNENCLPSENESKEEDEIAVMGSVPENRRISKQIEISNEPVYIYPKTTEEMFQ